MLCYGMGHICDECCVMEWVTSVMNAVLRNGSHLGLVAWVTKRKKIKLTKGSQMKCSVAVSKHHHHDQPDTINLGSCLLAFSSLVYNNLNNTTFFAIFFSYFFL